jgi:hypothetical protein
MTIRQLKQHDFLRRPFLAAMHLAAAGNERSAKPDCGPRKESNKGSNKQSNTVLEFPKRPDSTVLNETIPLFYIGQNRKGRWVVREAGGRSGGLFLFRRSAVRFAREESEASGCALMFINKPLELDIENRGSDFAEPLTEAIDAVKRRAPRFATFVGMAVAQWQKLLSQISRAIAGERRNRAAIERELFHGQYRLLSKNDDDLPIVD